MSDNQSNLDFNDFVSQEVLISVIQNIMSYYNQLNSRVKTLEEIHDIQSNPPNNNEQSDSNAAVGAAVSGGRRRKNKKKSRRRRRRRKRRTRKH